MPKEDELRKELENMVNIYSKGGGFGCPEAIEEHKWKIELKKHELFNGERTSVARTHTKFNIPMNRVGKLLTLDELLLIWNEAERLIESFNLDVDIRVFVEDCSAKIEVKDDLSRIEIWQHHMHPQALVYRELGNCSKIKTPTAKRISELVKNYF